MRTYPHKPKEKDLQEIWQEQLDTYQSDTQDVAAAILGRKVNFFKIRCTEAQDLACLSYAFEQSLGQVRQFLAEACGCAEKAVEFGVKLDPVLYMGYLSLAIVSRQSGFRKLLEGLQRQQYTHPEVDCDEIFYLAAEAMAALSASQGAAAQELVTKALARARSGEVNKLARSVMEPVLMLEAAIAHEDAQGLVPAIQALYEENRASYSQRAAKSYPSGLLDVRGVALLALARQHGLALPPTNVYMPLELSEETK